MPGELILRRALTLVTRSFALQEKALNFRVFFEPMLRARTIPKAELADQERLLPPLREGEELKTKTLEPNERQTQPSPRYTEGSLIKELNPAVSGVLAPGPRSLS